jgi:hypothetical protein
LVAWPRHGQEAPWPGIHSPLQLGCRLASPANTLEEGWLPAPVSVQNDGRHGDRACSRVALHFVSPETQDMPIRLNQLRGLNTVAFAVSGNLGTPILGVGSRYLSASGTTVPEASIDEDRDAARYEHEVWPCSCRWPSAPPSPEPQVPHFQREQLLQVRPSRTDRRHGSAPTPHRVGLFALRADQPWAQIPPLLGSPHKAMGCFR